MLIGLAIGTSVGILLGLTGAGGAILAIPAFVHLIGLSLNDATDMSLIAVWSGAFLSWWVQRDKTHYRIVVPVLLFSSTAILALRPLKAITPPQLTLALIVTVSAVTLVSLWRPKKQNARSSVPRESWIRIGITGLSLGTIMTMTGLGGGVVLVPLLHKVLGLTLQSATPTSLLMIFLSSSVAGARILSSPSFQLDMRLIGALVTGSLVAAVVVRAVVNRVETTRLDRIRKRILTTVIVVSVASLMV